MSAISLEDARAILDDRNLIATGARGDEERRRRHGLKTTFVRVFEVHVDSVPSTLPASVKAGELRIIGRPSSLAAAAAAVEAACAAAARIPVTAFSLADLLELADGSMTGVADVCARLAGAGLRSIAEAPVDALPNPIAVIRTATSVGLSVPRLTVRELKGELNGELKGRPKGELKAELKGHDRLVLLSLARDVQSAVGGVRVFAPLPRVSSVAQPSTGYDDVRQIAVARLLIDNIQSIQVDWALYGPKLAQVALTMGADDVDGVSPLEGDLGHRRSPLEEIRGNISAAGLEAVERDAEWRFV